MSHVNHTTTSYGTRVRDTMSSDMDTQEPIQPQDDWERRLLEAASDCGVSLADEALRREALYD